MSEEVKNEGQPPLHPGITRDGRNMPPLGFFGRIALWMLRGISRLPLGVLYVFSDLARFLMYNIARYRLKVVRANLLTVFPNKSEQERKDIERRFYRHICDYFVETIKALTISDEELKRRMKIRNFDVCLNLHEQGKSLYLYAAHLGNWEWFTCVPIYVPKGRNYEISCFYQPQSNPVANYMTVEVRTRRGIVACESQKAFRYFAKNIADGVIGQTLVVGDQCPHSGAQKYWLDFFGQDTPFLVGPAHIAHKLNIALVYPSFVAYKRGYYEVEMKVIEAETKSVDPKVLTERFAAYIEDDIRRIPELWLWSHRRWKLHHADFPDEKHTA